MEKKPRQRFRVIDGENQAKGERRQFRPMSPRRLLPAMLTLLAMSLGFTSLLWAQAGRYEAVLILIVIAAILDAIDGRLARFFKGDSRFGAELDSLADFLNFGVAPAFILWLWGLNGLGNLGVVIAFFFAMCCALRLARYNASLDDEGGTPDKRFFSGVPAPAGGLLVLTPMLLGFLNLWPDNFSSVAAFFVVGVALLMVSPLPTFSHKMIKFRIPRRNFVPILLSAVVMIVMIFNFPLEALLLLSAAYMVSLPVSAVMYYRQKMEKT